MISAPYQGECDFLITLTATRGISEDHAESFALRITDNDRGKTNLTTDYDFFQDDIAQV